MSKESGAKIAELRDAEKMSQAAFAKGLGVAQSLISAVEKGKAIPAHLAVRLGNYAAEIKRYQDAVWFWQLAGVKASALVPATIELLRATESPITRGAVTMVPPTENGGRYLAFPSEVLPNPLAVRYIVLPDDALLPLFKRGDVLIVDDSETKLRALIGSQIVIMRHTSSLLRKGAQLVRGYERSGLYVGWLRSSGPSDSAIMLDRPSVDGGIRSDVIEANGQLLFELQVIGRVVSWIDMQGKSLPREAEQPQPQKPAEHKSAKGKKKK
jgi:transcriptional regulator with XRE-family HTH domain